MKSRTSFFNATVFRKNITRFAPAWVIYTVLLFLEISTFPFLAVSQVSILANAMASWNFIYAPLCACLVFGDLFKSRLCNGLHALPITRENWFFTNCISGIVFAVVPNLLLSLYALYLCDGVWLPALGLFLSANLSFLFFFGLSVLCVMAAGKKLGMLFLYLLANFGIVLLLAVFEVAYLPLLYGVIPDLEWTFWLCPWARLFMAKPMEINYDYSGIYDTATVSWGDGWWILLIYAAAGILLAGLGLWLYRRRKLESAGDFLAFNGLKPVYLILHSLCVGLFFYIFGQLPFMVFGMILGFITGSMLIERTLKVFHPKNLILWAISLGIFLLSIALTKLDPLGITRWAPDPEDVESISLAEPNEEPGYPITDPEMIEQIIEAHKDALDPSSINYHWDFNQQITLVYKLNSGITRERSYAFASTSDAYDTIARALSTPEYVFGKEAADWETFTQSLNYAEVSNKKDYIFTGEDLTGLIEAIRLDCEAGTTSQFNGTIRRYYITLDAGDTELRIAIYATCKNTLAWLEAHGVTEHVH